MNFNKMSLPRKIITGVTALALEAGAEAALAEKQPPDLTEKPTVKEFPNSKKQVPLENTIEKQTGLKVEIPAKKETIQKPEQPLGKNAESERPAGYEEYKTPNGKTAYRINTGDHKHIDNTKANPDEMAKKLSEIQKGYTDLSGVVSDRNTGGIPVLKPKDNTLQVGGNVTWGNLNDSTPSETEQAPASNKPKYLDTPSLKVDPSNVFLSAPSSNFSSNNEVVPDVVASGEVSNTLSGAIANLRSSIATFLQNFNPDNLRAEDGETTAHDALSMLEGLLPKLASSAMAGELPDQFKGRSVHLKPIGGGSGVEHPRANLSHHIKYPPLNNTPIRLNPNYNPNGIPLKSMKELRKDTLFRVPHNIPDSVNTDWSKLQFDTSTAPVEITGGIHRDTYTNKPTHMGDLNIGMHIEPK